MVAVQATVTMSNMISSPFLPFLLEHMGVQPLSQVANWTGIIMASNSLSAAVFAPIWGMVGDRTGRKAMVLRSAIAVGLSTGLMGFCTTPLELFGVRALTGMFSGFSSSALALVATQVPRARLGYALGWLSTGQITGQLMGPLVGGLLIDWLHDFRTVFLISAIGPAIIAASCASLVRERRRERPTLDEHPATPWQEIVAVLQRPGLAPMFVVILLAQVSAVGVQSILPLYVARLVGDVPWVATASGAVFAITGVAGLLGAPFLGRRSDRIGYRTVLLISLAGTALFTLPQAFVASIGGLLALRFGLGVFLGGVLPSANAAIGNLARGHERGKIFGVTSTAQFLGRFVGPILGGVVAAHFGLSAVFVVIAGLMLANLLWVALAGPREKTAT
jgi:DHA1 family multidrug resistance protein-like MFS transporter